MLKMTGNHESAARVVALCESKKPCEQGSEPAARPVKQLVGLERTSQFMGCDHPQYPKRSITPELIMKQPSFIFIYHVHLHTQIMGETENMVKTL